ncbi:iron donor protein CyaY [Agarivorans sp. 1_MG-2023]|uniref:iron donor protein CyaY n=1 Tax=Agarivorans sp. 1_MG-2023 TaxID=3062634 RepID=UPI0026E1DACA|nr:iron donor protein CyaY [Agarivorans sp. 1_MG-2023]MDO6764394.1 iron donor protein CyaY [Agarivorans sp. 1_MG-2023]
MNDSQYHQLVDQAFERIEQTMDNDDFDIECDVNGGVLNLEFENRSKMVINKQEPLHQLWLATKFGGFHFEWHETEQQWICNRSGVEFWSFLVESITKQSGEQLSFD